MENKDDLLGLVFGEPTCTELSISNACEKKCSVLYKKILRLYEVSICRLGIDRRGQGRASLNFDNKRTFFHVFNSPKK